MLHTIEVRQSAISDALINKISNLTSSYRSVDDLMVVPQGEYDVNTVPGLLETVLSADWFEPSNKTQKTEWVTRGVGRTVILLAEADGNRAAFYLTHDESDPKCPNRVYFGYSSTLEYNTHLFSGLGLTTPDWRFCTNA